MHRKIEELGLGLFEKKKLRLWLKDHTCDKDEVIIRFIAGEAIAYCGCSTKNRPCKTNLSSGILKN